MATYTGTTYNVLGNVIPNDHFAYKFYAEVTYTQSVTNNTTTFTIKPYDVKTNEPVNVVDCEHFTTNVLAVKGEVERNYSLMDSFVILMGVEGDLEVCWDGGVEPLKMGETILVPASMENITLKSLNKAKVLEVYIKNK